MKNTHKIIILTLAIFTSLAVKAQPTKDDNLRRFNQIVNYIDAAYVEDVDYEKIVNKAIDALISELDPHSSYIPKKEVEAADERIRGDFVGIGVRFQVMKDTMNVSSVIPGGPAEKVGLQDNDKIVFVDGETIAGTKMSTSEIRKRLMGELGSKVKVTVFRGKNNTPLDFTITRGKIRINSVDCAYMIDDQIGYIKLNAFSRSTTEEMDSSITLLKKQGMKKLVLDLQNNSGGLMYASKDLADNFISGNKLLVYSQGKKQPRADLNAGQKNLFEKGELIILINEFSASASEIVAGAIQDWDRGLIIGRRSFGKGLVQRPIPLIDGAELRLTIAKYYTPSGRNIQKPYENVDDYELDYLKRLKHGETVTKDSIHFPDSLKFKTLVKKRDVYGGGGIMPDIFVPMDTSALTPYFNKLFRGGYFNTFTFEYSRANKAELLAKYPTIKEFKANFTVDDKLRTAFTDYANKEDSALIYNELEYEQNKIYIETRLKGLIASDLYGFENSYQILNDLNQPLQEAVRVLKNNEYKNFKLDK
ncbi:MAG TPA: S41 family peptidase [Crocinitomicaceae bacterium]|nr:S41 family peptidase [Crocinitomicaceae bacterium]